MHLDIVFISMHSKSMYLDLSKWPTQFGMEGVDGMSIFDIHYNAHDTDIIV